MQMAMAVGECSGEDADLLRRAMGSKRGLEKIESLREKLYEGMASNGLTGEVADEIYAKIQAFANFGFAESHSLSFALLVYASSWLKLHYPAAFLAGLLRAQPMGFYSPATLTADARRHGVEVRRPDILRSGGGCAARAASTTARRPRPPGMPACADRHQPGRATSTATAPDDSAEHRRDGNGRRAARAGRGHPASARRSPSGSSPSARRGRFRDMEDLVRRIGLTTAQLESLATAGAFDSFELSRREALWRAGSAAQDREEFLADSVVTVQPPLFADPSAFETLASDLWATGISTDDHPLRHFRARLADRGVLSAAALRTPRTGAASRSPGS